MLPQIQLLTTGANMFPNAKLLREEHDSYSTKKMQEVLSLVGTAILEAHQRSEVSVDLSSIFRKENSWHLSNAVKEYLQHPDRAFKVSDTGQYNEHYFSVSW